MLVRRAAGVMPRTNTGMDLVIPMFKDSEVSIIMIQVKTHEYPDCAVQYTRPRQAFGMECADKDGHESTRH
jgi:hypothetical protein